MIFAKDIRTSIITGDLVEIYRMLNQARLTGNLVHLSDAMDCIASQIDSNTKVPGRYTIKPSVSSIIMPGCEPGLVVNNAGGDIRCAQNLPVSFAMSGGVCQCDKTCPHFENNCYPVDGRIQLACGQKTGYTLMDELNLEASIASNTVVDIDINTPIAQIVMDTRALNALLRYFGTKFGTSREFTYGDILNIPDDELPTIRGIGEKSVAYLRTIISAHHNDKNN